MCYSTDVLKKFTFERELEHLLTLPPEEKNKTLIDYFTNELKRIQEQYGNDPTRT